MSRVIYGDGWHQVCGFRVYVENKRIVYGVSSQDWQQRTTYPYIWYNWANCWVNVRGVTVNAFRSAYQRGRAIMQ